MSSKGTALTEAGEPSVVQLPKPRAVMTPLEMASAAIKSGNVEIVREGFTLFKEMQAHAALVAFNNAIADAKAEIPPIRKNRHVGFKSKKQGAADTSYHHEDLAEIARTIDPIIAKHGLSYRFRTTSKLNEPISVTCIISHRDGHFEENTLSGGRDDSGNKNPLQGVASTVTYLSRYSLKAALGLAASDDADDDGASSDNGPETLTEAEIEHLRTRLKSKEATEAAFLKWAKVDRIEDIRADRYDACISAIEGFRKS